MRTVNDQGTIAPFELAPQSGKSVKLGYHKEIPEYDVSIEPAEPAESDVVASLSSVDLAPDGRQLVVCHFENFGSTRCVVRITRRANKGRAGA